MAGAELPARLPSREELHRRPVPAVRLPRAPAVPLPYFELGDLDEATLSRRGSWPLDVRPAPLTQRSHRVGWGAYAQTKTDAVQPLRAYSTPALRERVADAILRMRLGLAILVTIAAAMVLVAIILAAVHLIGWVVSWAW